jgi:lipopolysaccharide transport system permease protein
MINQTQLDTLSRYIELILYKTYADLRAEAERTYLGFLWWIFEPIMYMFVYYIFFAIWLGHKTDDFVPFLLVGLTIWQWLKSCLSHGSETILGGHALMQHVNLPKVIFPIILILTDSVKFLFIFILLLIFLWGYGFDIGMPYLALPLLLLVQLLFTTALTFFLAAIIPFIPDLRFVIENILLAIFFVSGIIIKAEMVPIEYRAYYYLNPIVNLVEDYRNILMYNTWPSWPTLFIITVFSIIGIRLCVRLISHFEYIYPKVMQ